MKNFIQSGDFVTVVAAKNTVSGELVVMESLVGVAAITAAKDSALTIATKGIFELPKVPEEAVKFGMKVRVENGRITLSEKAVPAGISLEDSGPGTLTVKVKLCS